MEWAALLIPAGPYSQYRASYMSRETAWEPRPEVPVLYNNSIHITYRYKYTYIHMNKHIVRKDKESVRKHFPGSCFSFTNNQSADLFAKYVCKLMLLVSVNCRDNLTKILHHLIPKNGKNAKLNIEKYTLWKAGVKNPYSLNNKIK